MALTLKSIQAPIKEEIGIFETKFRDSMKSKVFLLDKITHYIVKRKGKQMRPMFVFLTAGLCGTINEKTYRGASLIELLHTASLVHDDVVDDANYRRGFFSVNAVWKNKIAVLVGDFLLSRGLLLSVEHKDYDLLEIMSEAVKMMSEGELMQIEKARSLKQTEVIYYDIIKQKTASLISACCAVGVASVSGNQEQINLIKKFGEKVGMAFQIKDDLFDYGKDEIGKPLGIDIKEKKLTLPLIFSLTKAPSKEGDKIRNLIRNKSNLQSTVDEVFKFVKKYGGLDYATTVMNRFYQESLDTLDAFPDSEYKSSLKQIVKYTIERKN